MKNTLNRFWKALSAVCAVALAAMLQAQLQDVVGERFPLLFFFPAVTLTALYGGATAGLLATFLSTLLISYQLVPRGHFFMVQQASDRVGLLVFIISGTAICLIVKTLHNLRIRAAEAELQARVAEVRRADAAKLLESEARYRILFENNMDAVFLTVPDGTVIAANPVACAMFGRTEEELCRIGRAGVVDQGDPSLQEALAQRVREGRLQCELTCVRGDGTTFEAEVSSVILHDENHSFVIIRDITPRKLAEQTQKRYAQRLIVQEEDLRKSIAMDLHDHVGQLLVALGFNLRHLGLRVPEGAAADVPQILEDSRLLLKDVNTSIRDLMAELRPHQLDTLGLVEAIRSYGMRYQKRTGIKVEVLAGEDFPRLGSTLETALFRITQEALNNTSKYSGASKVTVVLHDAGGVSLTITDDGKGFEPQSDLPQPTGSGWGLTIMRERTELLGGRFSLETAPGRGTTIRVTVRDEGMRQGERQGLGSKG
ncbi:ATP-binding protein [Geomonas silvestris]|uniref:ATP-binding protein n=1 Tax=Geomonas silvestris TaxID=2740184 RepID=UPI00161579BB|nr:ATP-binding protein [Geomonas silvestris]